MASCRLKINDLRRINLSLRNFNICYIAFPPLKKGARGISALRFRSKTLPGKPPQLLPHPALDRLFAKGGSILFFKKGINDDLKVPLGLIY